MIEDYVVSYFDEELEELVLDEESFPSDSAASRKLLTREEEIELVNAFNAGDRRAAKTIIDRNIGLIKNIIARFRDKGLTYEELLQAGKIGIYKALQKFNPKRGYKFSTYATYWIRQTVSRAVINESRTIRVPIHAYENGIIFQREVRRFRVNNEREPTIEEIIVLLKPHIKGINKKKVEQIIQNLQDLDSLDDEVGGQQGITRLSFEMAPASTEPEARIEAAMDREQLHKWLACLEPQERDLVLHKYGFFDCGLDKGDESLEYFNSGEAEKILRQALIKLRKIADHNLVNGDYVTRLRITSLGTDRLKLIEALKGRGMSMKGILEFINRQKVDPEKGPLPFNVILSKEDADLLLDAFKDTNVKFAVARHYAKRKAEVTSYERIWK